MECNLICHTTFATIASTSIMTLSSYCYSSIRRKQFNEPEILNDLMMRLNVIKTKSISKHQAGWVIHYLVGLQFIIGFKAFLNLSHYEPTITLFIILGAICGVIGILGWKFTFSAHPNPPALDFKEFYIQLFFAHIIFGVIAYLVFLL